MRVGTNRVYVNSVEFILINIPILHIDFFNWTKSRFSQHRKQPKAMQIGDKTELKSYQAASNRYDSMTYNRCGKSGILLPAISLGLWHNFGFVDSIHNAREMLRTAFDLGITHFDLANNYGPPYGSAEENFGVIFKKDFKPYRDELFIASKAGYDMWPGPLRKSRF